jgi:hypothetical protein
MIVISNYQYAFTLFTPGLRQQFPGAPYAQIAATISSLGWAGAMATWGVAQGVVAFLFPRGKSRVFRREFPKSSPP